MRGSGEQELRRDYGGIEVYLRGDILTVESGIRKCLCTWLFRIFP